MSVDSAIINFITIFQKCIEIENAGQEVSQDLRNSLIEAVKDLVEASAEYLDYDLDDELKVLTETLQEPTNENLKSCQSIVGELIKAGKKVVTTVGTTFMDSYCKKLAENAADGTTEALKDKASKVLEKINGEASAGSSNGNAGPSAQVEVKQEKSGEGNASGSAQVEDKNKKERVGQTYASYEKN